MSPDTIILSAICHEESRDQRPKTRRTQSEPLPQTSTTTFLSNLDTTVADMPTSNDARKRSLVTMYSTGFVFNQNQKNLVKAIPWANHNNSTTTTLPQNPMLSSSLMQKMVSQVIQSHDDARKVVGEKQVQNLHSEKIRAEHAASMFALLT